MYTELPVSIIVTCHNLHDYLPECVESLKNQTMTPTEIVIVHDGCTPPPVFPDTKLVIYPHNRGVGYARNQGVAVADGDYILFVDADDCLNEYFLEAMLKTQQQYREQAKICNIIYPNVLLWSSWRKDVPMKNAWHESPDQITMKNMMEFNQIVISSLIPKWIYTIMGGMKDEPILEDYAFWLRCVRDQLEFVKSPQSVLKYRQRANGRNRKNHELKNKWYYKIREEYESQS